MIYTTSIYLTSTTIPKILDDTSAVALIEVIEKHRAELSLEMDVYSSLWYVFHGMVCGYLATSHKLKNFKIMQRQLG